MIVRLVSRPVNTAWVAGPSATGPAGGTLYRTLDGGKSWKNQLTLSGDMLEYVSFAKPSLYYLAEGADAAGVAAGGQIHEDGQRAIPFAAGQRLYVWKKVHAISGNDLRQSCPQANLEVRLLRRRQFRRFISCKSPSSRHVSPLMLG